MSANNIYAPLNDIGEAQPNLHTSEPAHTEFIPARPDDGIQLTKESGLWQRIWNDIRHNESPKSLVERGLKASSNLAWFFVPSFISSWLEKKAASADGAVRDEHERQSDRAFALDGLRGLAALFVMQGHILEMLNFGVFKRPARPVVDLPWHGFSMVAIFFVISGYVLSLSCLRQLKQGRRHQALSTLQSQTFRRLIRLFLPGAAAILMWGLLAEFGGFEAAQRIWQDRERYPLAIDPWQPPGRLASFWAQLYDATKDVLRLFDSAIPFNAYPIEATRYDGYQWTLMCEARDSITLFGTLFATAQFSSPIRIVILLLLIIWTAFNSAFIIVSRSDTNCFFIGAFVAQLDLITKSACAPKEEEQCEFTWSHSAFWTRWLLSRWLTWPLFILALCLLSCSPGTNIVASPLLYILPPAFMSPLDVIRNVGAGLTVWCVLHEPLLEAFLRTAPVQYLGRISFSLYLVHGPILRSMGFPLALSCLSLVQGVPEELLKSTESAAWLAMILILLVIGPVAIYVADLFTRAVDEPSIRLGRKIEAFLVVDSDPQVN